ncbi:hypothetical protein AVEN_36662-1 [Araneus ventricosus]|uniref:Uncharacterized protein n=1 Tax=Araneus ventricosus TaxID=182803 RepID=A0A4Y2QUX9_ARAVE|nr:hypothetical protein AVEN_36662-1 [Araneus ventricosus]
MDKVKLLPSGVQGLVPTEAALSAFTMKRSPIVLDFLWASGLLDLDLLRTRTSGIRNNSNTINAVSGNRNLLKNGIMNGKTSLCLEMNFGSVFS